MLKPSDCVCEVNSLPAVLNAALGKEFAAKGAKNGVRISPTAELLARREWQQLAELDLPFESAAHMTEFVLQAVRAQMKRLMEGEAS